jgi:hypothetical protein
MDPLSIVVSVIAMAQAGDRIMQLVQRIRQYFNASEQIDALADELSDLRLVLDTVQKAASNLPTAYFAGLKKALHGCNRTVIELETLLADLSFRSAKVSSSLQSQMHRVR